MGDRGNCSCCDLGYRSSGCRNSRLHQEKKITEQADIVYQQTSYNCKVTRLANI